jgi:RimJ/RimL family protein N-acetyltransferase
VLSLLDKSAPGLSIRLTDAPVPLIRPTDVAAAATITSETPLAPTLGNADLRLTTVEPDDVRFLYTLATHADTCYRWRYRGAPPPIDRFMGDLWSQVLIQFVARRNDDGEPVGHVVAYGADLGQGYAYIGAVFRPPYSGTGLAAQGTAMFIRYLFHTYALRKLYIEVPGFNWPQMRSGEGRQFEVEGIMRDHEFYAGQYWDRYLCAIYPKHLKN